MWRMKSSTAQRQFIVQFLLAYLQLASQYVPVPLLSEPVWWCDRWLYFWVLIDKASLIIGWKSETLWGNWFGFTWAKDLGLFWCLYCLPVSLSCSLSLFQSPSLWSHSVSLWKNLVCSRTRLICPRICRCFWSTILKLARKERERESGRKRRRYQERGKEKEREAACSDWWPAQTALWLRPNLVCSPRFRFFLRKLLDNFSPLCCCSCCDCNWPLEWHWKNSVANQAVAATMWHRLQSLDARFDFWFAFRLFRFFMTFCCCCCFLLLWPQLLATVALFALFVARAVGVACAPTFGCCCRWRFLCAAQIENVDNFIGVFKFTHQWA